MSDSHEQAGFVAPEPADLAPLFPGYDIQGLIATGGMGAVYCAVQKSLDRTVALKILPMEFSKDAAFCAGFEAEAKAMARLNHPNLIGVFDFGEVNGMLFIIMEFVPGKSVYHSAYGMAIDQEEVIRLVTGICNGLAHAHEYGIIHRDIKPSNILLDLNAQPKIGDFGLARPIDRKIEEGEEIFGTPHYTAPEVVNSPHAVDHRADIFSVGVLLHELLTGMLPASDPRPPSTIVHCDPRFDTIVRRATQHVPAARYSSAKEIANDLQVIAASLGPKGPRAAVVAAPRRAAPVRAYTPVKAKKSSGAPIMVFLLAAVLAGIGALVYFAKTQPAKAPAPTAVVPPPAPKTPPSPQAPVADPTVEPGPDLLPDPPPNAQMDPVAEPVPEPDPEVGAEPQVDPAAEPVAAVVIAPKYDVGGFFERARKIMSDRAKPLISGYEANLKANCTDFERSAKRLIRKFKMDGDEVDKTLETAVAGWINDGGRIPDDIRSTLAAVPGLDGVYDGNLQKQVGLDDTLQLELSKLSATYILGLEKQIERLKADNDAGAITLVEKEIEKTKESPKYFSDLMLGKETEQNSSDAE